MAKELHSCDDAVLAFVVVCCRSGPEIVTQYIETMFCEESFQLHCLRLRWGITLTRLEHDIIVFLFAVLLISNYSFINLW